MSENGRVQTPLHVEAGEEECGGRGRGENGSLTKPLRRLMPVRPESPLVDNERELFEVPARVHSMLNWRDARTARLT